MITASDTIGADLEWLRSNTRSFSIEVNEQRASYCSVAEEIAPNKDWGYRYSAEEFGSPEIRQACIDTNTLITVHVYPETPVGFVLFHGATIPETVSRARREIEAAK